MKNRDKFKPELENLMIYALAMNEKGEICKCSTMDCKMCAFYKGDFKCRTRIELWLDEEFVEPVQNLTRRERDFIDCIAGDFSLIRENDGSVCMSVSGTVVELDSDMFKFVKKAMSKKDLLEMGVEE